MSAQSNDGENRKSEIVNRSTELTTKSEILTLSPFGSGLSRLGVKRQN